MGVSWVSYSNRKIIPDGSISSISKERVRIREKRRRIKAVAEYISRCVYTTGVFQVSVQTPPPSYLGSRPVSRMLPGHAYFLSPLTPVVYVCEDTTV